MQESCKKLLSTFKISFGNEFTVRTIFVAIISINRCQNKCKKIVINAGPGKFYVNHNRKFSACVNGNITERECYNFLKS